MFSGFNRFGRGLVLGVAATVLAAGAAGAQQGKDAAAANRMLAGVTADEIISILTENQIQSQRVPSEGNDPWVLGTLQSGAKFYVRLQGCGPNSSNCQVIVYGAIFTGTNLPTTDFNTFNGRYSFGKTYKDSENQVFIEHPVSVAGGIRRAAVEVNMFVFFSMAELFTKFLSERMSTVSASLDKPKPGAITNQGGPLPADSSLAALRRVSAKHPEIVNKVQKGKPTKWATK